MIHESAPWKAQLLRDAALMERWAQEAAHTESRSFRMERRVLLAAYSMRKLDDALKVSTDVLGDPIGVLQFRTARPGYSAHNNYGFERYFDLHRPHAVQLPRRRLLNILIHSLVFIEVVGDGGTYEGFMVTSDRESERGLLQVQMSDYVALMREVGRDYPSRMRSAFDARSGRWVTWAGHGDPPADVMRRLQKALTTNPKMGHAPRA